jgi:hypothetical protein
MTADVLTASPETADVRRRLIQAFALASPALVLAAVLYEPWRMTAFPVSDWGALLTLFRASDSPTESFRALMSAYGSTGEGRFLPVHMAWLSAEWALVGQDPAAWQAVRFSINSAVIVGLVMLLLQVGVEAAFAAVSALLVVVASAAPQGWYVPHISEPAGALFLVTALLLAVRYSSARHPRAIATGIALSLTCAVLSKEMFLAAIPFVLGVALVGPDHRETIRMTRRWIELVVVVSVVTLTLCVVPILWVRASAPASAYAGSYSLASAGIENVGTAVAVMLFPVTREVWFPANLGFFAIVGTAIWLTFRRRWLRKGALLLAALSAPLLGALLHAPWPRLEGYYGFAYLPAVAVALATSLSVIRGGGNRALTAGSYAAVGVVVLYGALFARERAHLNRASREVEMATVQALGRLVPDTLLVAVEDPRHSGALGDGLMRYAAAHAIPIAGAAADVACPEAMRTLSQERRRVAVLAFSHQCSLDGVRDPRWHAERRIVSREWKTWRRTEQMIDARLWTLDSPDVSPATRSAAAR